MLSDKYIEVRLEMIEKIKKRLKDRSPLTFDQFCKFLIVDNLDMLSTDLHAISELMDERMG